MSEILNCKKISKSYYDGSNKIKVLKSLSLTLNTGEKIAIIGRSGSGKTTLLNVLAGLDAPDSGEVLLLNKDLMKVSESALGKIRNECIGVVLQAHHLLAEFSALENVAIPLLLRKMPLTEAKAKAKKYLAKVGLSTRINHRPAKLSGGEQQRVAIARALVTEPKFILADEPTGSLDSENAEKIFNLMLELTEKQNSGLIVVTHDLEIAKKLDRTYILNNGKLDLD